MYLFENYVTITQEMWAEVILYLLVLLYGERKGLLPEKFAHLNYLSIRSFDYGSLLISYSAKV